MSHVFAILLGAVITALFSGIILESYKRHRDLQGVASAVAALIFLRANNGHATIGEIQPYYAAGVESAPEFYTNYPFDGWLGFLVNQGLTTREGEIVSLLPAGKAIISYMQMRGYLRFRAKG